MATPVSSMPRGSWPAGTLLRAGQLILSLGLPLLLSILLASVPPARAFDLPGLGELLGTANPLSALGDSLPERSFVELGLDARKYYRSKRGSRLHDYGGADHWVVGMATVTTDLWAGLRYSGQRLSLVQSEVYSEGDALDGGRDSRHLSAVVAGRRWGWEVRALAGAMTGERGGAEGALELRGSWGPLDRLAATGWLWRGALRLDQTINQTTFFFPFQYHDEVGEIELLSHRWRGYRVGGSVRRQRVVGDKIHPEQYNLLDVSRWRYRARLERERKPRLDLSMNIDRSTASLSMALDGTRYVQARDLHLDRWGIELGWGVRGDLRLMAGLDRWDLRSRDPSFADVWPFTVWDVFTSTRFRLESADKEWRINYVGIDWQPWRSPSFDLRLSGRMEWWSDEGKLLWKERVPVLAPFFFRFDHHEDSLEWPATNGFELVLSLRRSLGFGTELLVDGRSVIPFGKDAASQEIDTPPAPESGPPRPSESAWGGLWLVSRLRWWW